MIGLRALAGLLCSLPWVRALPGVPASLARAIDVSFFGLCHHWPGRVLVLGGDAMCVCSRCAGLYAGLALGFLLPAAGRSDRVYGRALTIAVAAAVLDVVTQDAGLHAPNHAVRLLTGAAMGWTVAAWMVAAISRSPRSRPRPQLG